MMAERKVQAIVKTVWIVAKSDNDYPYFKVLSIVPDEEKALDEASYFADFLGQRAFYWKAQEVDTQGGM